MKIKGFIAIVFILICSASFGQIRKGRTQTFDPNPSGLDYSRPQEYEIANIRVEGTTYLDGNTLVSLTGLKVGDRIRVPGEDISSAIKSFGSMAW